MDEVSAELLPADKVTRVEGLVARYGAVAMVSDGVDDAPAIGPGDCRRRAGATPLVVSNALRRLRR